MNHYYPFINTPLPYDYHALEPYIDQKTMHLHHDRHLQTYIDNLNTLLGKNPVLQRYSLAELVTNWNTFPKQLQIPVRNQAGGVYNHRFFFEGMSRPGQNFPENTLTREIQKQFHSFDSFKTLFKDRALSVFGSGYAWLVLEQDMLKIITTPNQNTPDLKTQRPILTLDVWEHAYYLKHYNLRAAYIDDWFHVVNWNKAKMHFQQS